MSGMLSILNYYSRDTLCCARAAVHRLSGLADTNDLRCMMAFLELAVDLQTDGAAIMDYALCYVLPSVRPLTI